MTKLLTEAVQCLRQFPPDVQNRVARAIILQCEEQAEPSYDDALHEDLPAFERPDLD